MPFTRPAPSAVHPRGVFQAPHAPAGHVRLVGYDGAQPDPVIEVVVPHDAARIARTAPKIERYLNDEHPVATRPPLELVG